MQQANSNSDGRITIAHAHVQERQGMSISDLWITNQLCRLMPAHPSVDLKWVQGGDRSTEDDCDGYNNASTTPTPLVLDGSGTFAASPETFKYFCLSESSPADSDTTFQAAAAANSNTFAFSSFATSTTSSRA
jgi:hypothetical protein